MHSLLKKSIAAGERMRSLFNGVIKMLVIIEIKQKSAWTDIKLSLKLIELINSTAILKI